MSCNRLLNAVFVTAMSLCVLGSARAEPPAWGEGLSDRELAIQRWFAHLTFLQERSAEHWAEWHDDGKQLGITSLRYQLAFGGYGCAAMAAKTPAYREIVSKQLLDLCERMIDVCRLQLAQRAIVLAARRGSWDRLRQGQPEVV